MIGSRTAFHFPLAPAVAQLHNVGEPRHPMRDPTMLLRHLLPADRDEIDLTSGL